MTAQSNEERDCLSKGTILKTTFKSQFFDYDQTGYQNETDFDISKEYLRSQLSDKTQIFNKISQQSFLKVVEIFFKLRFQESFVTWRKKVQILKKIQGKSPKKLTKLFLKIFYTLNKKIRSKTSWSMIKILNFAKNYDMKTYQPPIKKGINLLALSYETLFFKYFQGQSTRQTFYKILNYQNNEQKNIIFKRGIQILTTLQRFYYFLQFKEKMQKYKKCQTKIQIFLGTMSLSVYPILRGFYRNISLHLQYSRKQINSKLYQTNSSSDKIIPSQMVQAKIDNKMTLNLKTFETQQYLSNLSSPSKSINSNTKNLYYDQNKDKKYLFPKKRFESQDSNQSEVNCQSDNLYEKILESQFQRNQNQKEENTRTLKFVKGVNKISINNNKSKNVDEDQMKLNFKFKKVSDKKKTFKNTQKIIQPLQTSIAKNFNFQKQEEKIIFANLKINPATPLKLQKIKSQRIQIKKEEPFNQQFNSFSFNQKMGLLRQIKRDQIKFQIFELIDNNLNFTISESSKSIKEISKSQQKIGSLRSFNKIQNIHNIKKSESSTHFSTVQNTSYFNSQQTPKCNKVVFQNPYATNHLTIQNSQNPNLNTFNRITYKNQYFGDNKSSFQIKGPSQINQYFFPMSSQLLRSSSSSRSKLYSKKEEQRSDAIEKNVFYFQNSPKISQNIYKQTNNFKVDREVSSTYLYPTEQQKKKENIKTQQLCFKTKRPRKQMAKSSQKVKLVSNYYISGEKQSKINEVPLNQYYQPNYRIQKNKFPISQNNSQKHISYQIKNLDIKSLKKPGQFSVVKSYRK